MPKKTDNMLSVTTQLTANQLKFVDELCGKMPGTSRAFVLRLAVDRLKILADKGYFDGLMST